ncbi:hypothetical protein VOLCADRAFT_120003, partial [Volvox carteri f. nagariensis]
MAPTKELKPPQELVDAIQQSDDMTAPAGISPPGVEFGHDVPRAIRNRLVHEEPQQLRPQEHPVGAEGMSKEELK